MRTTTKGQSSGSRNHWAAAAMTLLAALSLSAVFAGCSAQNSAAPASAATDAATAAPAATSTQTATLSPKTEATPSSNVDIEVSLNAYPSVWCPAVSSQGSIRLSAKDSSGKPVPGDWSAARGAFVLPPVKNEDGTISTPDQEAAKELKGQAEVGWLLPEADRKESGSIEVRFSQGGQSTVLLLNWDSDMGLISIGERLVAFTDDERSIIKGFSALVTGKKTTGEQLAYSKQNIGKLGNGLGEVLADGLVNAMESGRLQYSDVLDASAEDNYDALSSLQGRDDFKKFQSGLPDDLAKTIKPLYDNGYLIRFQEDNIYADINWKTVKAALDGKEGNDLAEYIRLTQQEDEKPFVVEGTLEIPLTELAQRYIDARNYVAAYPRRDGWYSDAEVLYKDSYLSSMLILNGALFAGDDFTVPDNEKAAYDSVISKFASDDLGKLLADYKALLKKNDWKLTNDIRDFLTNQGVQGYGRID
jgi:hypothetical protein